MTEGVIRSVGDVLRSIDGNEWGYITAQSRRLAKERSVERLTPHPPMRLARAVGKVSGRIRQSIKQNLKCDDESAVMAAYAPIAIIFSIWLSGRRPHLWELGHNCCPLIGALPDPVGDLSAAAESDVQNALDGLLDLLNASPEIWAQEAEIRRLVDVHLPLLIQAATAAQGPDVDEQIDLAHWLTFCAVAVQAGACAERPGPLLDLFSGSPRIQSQLALALGL